MPSSLLKKRFELSPLLWELGTQVFSLFLLMCFLYLALTDIWPYRTLEVGLQEYSSLIFPAYFIFLTIMWFSKSWVLLGFLIVFLGAVAGSIMLKIIPEANTTPVFYFLMFIVLPMFGRMMGRTILRLSRERDPIAQASFS